MIYVTHAISPLMLGESATGFKLTRLNEDEARALVQGATSAIPSRVIAGEVSRVLRVTIRPRRLNLSLSPGAVLLTCVYLGPVIPPGANALPPGGTFTWWRVDVV